MRQTGIVMGIILLATNVFAWNEPTEFKGIAFGSSEEQFKQKIPGGCIDEPRLFPERICRRDLNIGQVNVYASFSFLKGGFAEVLLLFKPQDFTAIETAFTTKYGPPTDTEEQSVSTRGGLQAQNRLLQWRGTKINIMLQRYAGSLDRSSASIKTVELENEQLQRYDAQQKAGAKDL